MTANVEEPAARRELALARLAASRASLRAAWLPEAGAATASGSRRRLAARWRLWRRELGAMPVLGLALNLAEQWWQQHPWRAVGQVVAGEVEDALVPWVRRRPALSVALAAAAGAALVLARPWAWPVLGARLHALRALVGPWLLSEAARVARAQGPGPQAVNASKPAAPSAGSCPSA